jgi:peptidoglycan/xylan/chitin deacetylase (PgdA/CDA1 family)
MIRSRPDGDRGSGPRLPAGTGEVFLNFHGVGVPPPGTDRAERDYWWDERPFLKALDEVSVEMNGRASGIRITFDDGNASDVEIALPALRERNMTATFFVCAGRVGTRGYLDDSAIGELLSAGMRVGSHGMDHVDWRKLDESRLHAEIAGAKHKLEDLCGSRIDEVSIPFGSYDRRVLAKLRSEGYGRVYTSGGGMARRCAWLKPRNTLDRSWQWKKVLEGLAARETPMNRLRRALAERYKSLR